MAKALRIEDVSQDPPRELGILRSSSAPIGRDPEFGLRLDSVAVSRQHGIFTPMRSHWFYTDLGSTNGSWINDTAVPQKVMKIVRAGDYIQLADRMVTLVSLSPEQKDEDPMSSEGMWSLLVFLDGELKDEYPVPKSGKALIVGGKDGDLQFPDEADGRKQQEPTVVFERRKDGLYVFQVDTSREVALNGQPLQRSTKIEDNDSIHSDHFTILFNCPPLAKRKTHEWAVSPIKAAGRSEGVPVSGEGTLKSWGADTQGQSEQGAPGVMVHEVKRAAINPVFGKVTPTQADTGEDSGGVLTGPPVRDLNSTTTRVYTQGPIRREVYQPSRHEDYEEAEGLSPYKILIVVFALLSILLLIAVVSVLMS